MSVTMSLFDDIMLSIQKMPAGLPSQARPQGHRGSPQPECEPPPMLQPDSASQLSKAAARRARRMSEGLPAKSGSGVRKKHYARPQGAPQIARIPIRFGGYGIFFQSYGPCSAAVNS